LAFAPFVNATQHTAMNRMAMIMNWAYFALFSIFSAGSFFIDTYSFHDPS